MAKGVYLLNTLPVKVTIVIVAWRLAPPFPVSLIPLDSLYTEE